MHMLHPNIFNNVADAEDDTYSQACGRQDAQNGSCRCSWSNQCSFSSGLRTVGRFCLFLSFHQDSGTLMPQNVFHADLWFLHSNLLVANNCNCFDEQFVSQNEERNVVTIIQERNALMSVFFLEKNMELVKTTWKKKIVHSDFFLWPKVRLHELSCKAFFFTTRYMHSQSTKSQNNRNRPKATPEFCVLGFPVTFSVQRGSRFIRFFKILFE